MTIIDQFILFWLLPSLVGMLIYLNVYRYWDKAPISSMDINDWGLVFLTSIIYPIAFLLLLSTIIDSGILTKRLF